MRRNRRANTMLVAGGVQQNNLVPRHMDLRSLFKGRKKSPHNNDRLNRIIQDLVSRLVPHLAMSTTSRVA